MDLLRYVRSKGCSTSCMLLFNMGSCYIELSHVMAASNQQMIGAAPCVSIQNCSNITININRGQR